MSVLKAYFNREINQCSPVQEDYSRIPVYDEDGNEYITYQVVDYPALVASHGSVDDWSLQALLKAGINPSFGIHTGNPTRLEGVSDIEAMNIYLDSVLADDPKEDDE